MKIYVDADASPVKNIVIEEAIKLNKKVVLVKSFSHYSLHVEKSGVETVYVDTGADAADYKIMQLAKANDIIITQDYGLAALGLAKGCLVLHQNGFHYSAENMDILLDTRHQQAKKRRGGQKTKGPKAYTDQDREKFRKLLRSIISK